MAHEDLRKSIAKRKAADLVFAVVGFCSIAVGLATLAALMFTLWRDAQPRLWVKRGTVAVTEGRVRAPDGGDMSPAQMAHEARKINGDAVATLLSEPEEMAPNVLALDQLIDLEKVEGLAGPLGKIWKIDDDDEREEQADQFPRDATREAAMKSYTRPEHVRSLLDAGQFEKFVGLDRFVAKDRVDALRAEGAFDRILNRAELTALLERDGLESLINRRKLRGALEGYESQRPDLLDWVAQGETKVRRQLFVQGRTRILEEEKLKSLVNQQELEAVLRREYEIARARPEEFNSSFFFTLGPSAYPETTGILIAWVDSLLIIVVTMFAAIPIGVGAGVYLEEYAPKNRLTALIEINIANLAGVPSIIYGLMALGFFVYQLGMRRSIGTAGLTLALLVLPIVIMATRESIRAIPQHIREASYACGATRWQTVRYHILPYSAGGILTGSIIGLSRAIGETAPLITIGALTFVTTLPFQDGGDVATFEWVKSGFTAMPLLMYNLTAKPEAGFHQSAALAGIVLIVMTLSLNAVAIYLRYRLRRSIKW